MEDSWFRHRIGMQEDVTGSHQQSVHVEARNLLRTDDTPGHWTETLSDEIAVQHVVSAS